VCFGTQCRSAEMTYDVISASLRGILLQVTEYTWMKQSDNDVTIVTCQRVFIVYYTKRSHRLINKKVPGKAGLFGGLSVFKQIYNVHL